MAQLDFNGHFSDYKNQVQHTETPLALLRKQEKNDTIHCNTELMMQSKEPKARRK